jgi:DNA-binding XRE family transcriptional regulator
MPVQSAVSAVEVQFYHFYDQLCERNEGMSNRLRELRNERGLAQQGLAARARVSPAMIVAVERWGHVPGEVVQQKIATALGVQPMDIWPPEVALAGSAA